MTEGTPSYALATLFVAMVCYALMSLLSRRLLLLNLRVALSMWVAAVASYVLWIPMLRVTGQFVNVTAANYTNYVAITASMTTLLTVFIVLAALWVLPALLRPVWQQISRLRNTA
jgi:hypothetical protein